MHIQAKQFIHSLTVQTTKRKRTFALLADIKTLFLKAQNMASTYMKQQLKSQPANQTATMNIFVLCVAMENQHTLYQVKSTVQP